MSIIDNVIDNAIDAFRFKDTIFIRKIVIYNLSMMH